MSRRLTAHDVCHLHSYAQRLLNKNDHDDDDDAMKENDEETIPTTSSTVSGTIGLLYFFGSWNTTTFVETKDDIISNLETTIMPDIMTFVQQQNTNNVNFTQHVVGSIQVDESEDTLQLCIGDGSNQTTLRPMRIPETLPCFAVAVQYSTMEQAHVEFIPDIDLSMASILRANRKSRTNNNYYNTNDYDILSVSSSLHSILSNSKIVFKAVVSSILSSLHNNNDDDRMDTSSSIQPPQHDNNDEDDEEPLRIFVAGDRSNAGKSSICLGILGYCMTHLGYDPSSLAYIKPATQCESPQLIQTYCEHVGIACVPIGPIVYYKGFTRAYLAGETEYTNTELLHQVGAAVDELSFTNTKQRKQRKRKRLILIDGVGFPSVGSICGTDNVQVAKASGYPHQVDEEGDGNVTQRKPPAVLLVGISGVGAAVDAYNINATYFDYSGVPVIGAIFNKLSQDEGSYYSLENCKTQVTAYFEQQQHGRRAFGFVPIFSKFAETSNDSNNNGLLLDCVDEFIQVFGKYVDVPGIIHAAIKAKQEQQDDNRRDSSSSSSSSVRKRNSQKQKQFVEKKAKIFHASSVRKQQQPLLSRQAIEQRAAKSGAAPSA